jgi:hypothetical protein
LIFPKEKRLMLPEGKSGAPKVQIDVPINLPGKSQSALDADEIKKLQQQILGHEVGDLPKSQNKYKMLPEPKYNYNDTINLGGKADLDKQVLPKSKK